MGAVISSNSSRIPDRAFCSVTVFKKIIEDNTSSLWQMSHVKMLMVHAIAQCCCYIWLTGRNNFAIQQVDRLFLMKRNTKTENSEEIVCKNGSSSGQAKNNDRRR